MTGFANGAPRILIADDQPDVLESLRLLLKPERYRVETATDPEQVLGAVEKTRPKARIERTRDLLIERPHENAPVLKRMGAKIELG